MSKNSRRPESKGQGEGGMDKVSDFFKAVLILLQFTKIRSRIMYSISNFHELLQGQFIHFPFT